MKIRKSAVLERAVGERERISTLTRDFDVTLPIAKAYTVKKADGGGDAHMIDAIASSTVIDRMGDRISSKCLSSMQKQASALTLWLNHSYDVPEDVAGTITAPTIKAGNDGAQGPCEDLWVSCEIDVDNSPRAAMAYQQIKAGRKLGLSIGGYITDYSITDTPDGPVFTIEGMELFEISLVGIPANQRAIVNDVAKGLRKRLGVAPDPKKAAAQRRALERGADFSDETPDASAIAAPADPPNAADAQPVAAPIVTEPVPIAGHAAPADASAPIPGYASADVPTTKAGRAISAATAGKLAIVKKCITDAVGHGVCSEATKSLSGALDELDDLSDEADPDDDDDDTRAISDLATKRAAAEANLRDLLAMVKSTQVMRDELEIEIEFLKRFIGDVQDMPLARRSVSHGGSSRPSSTDPDRRRLSEKQLFQTGAAGYR